VTIGGGHLDAPGWADAQDQAAVAYVRTYDVELAPSPSGTSSLEAVVRHIRAFGPVVRLELDLVDGGRTIEAHLPRDRFEALALTTGRRVYVSPTNVRVFAEPEVP
jgi:ABC-type sulfate/molybdate transport systems ATPase subunit